MEILQVVRTSIDLGNIQLDAYTAHEQDENGRWINYLSGRGLANSVGALEQRLREKHMAKALRDRLGGDFSLREARYNLPNGTSAKISLWRTKYAMKFWFYEMKLGNQKAEIILDALAETALDIIIDEEFERGYAANKAKKMVVDRILSLPNPWEKLYDQAVCRTAFKWMGANFYWEFCYRWMSQEERCKLNQVNPLKNGKRRNGRIHQFIESETKTRLEPRIRELCVLLLSSTSEQDFRTRYNRYLGSDQRELL